MYFIESDTYIFDELEEMMNKLNIVLNAKNLTTSKGKQAQSKPKQKPPTPSLTSQIGFGASTIFDEVIYI